MTLELSPFIECAYNGIADSYEPPTFTHSPTDIVITTGEVVTVTCQAAGFPEPSITWRNVCLLS